MNHAIAGSHYRFTPRSIDDRAYWGATRQDPRYAPFVAWVEEVAAGAPERFPAAQASDFMAAPRFNDRSLLDRHWGATRRTFSALAVRRCLRGVEDEDPDDRLLNWLWGFLTEPTWAVVAHLPENDLPIGGTSVLDLAACEMAALLAEFREVLLPWLAQASSTIADRIVHEIDARILGPYGAGATVRWQDERNRWNNWTGVCAGSLLAACESLAAQGQPRPEARARALEGLAAYLTHSFTPHAECDEGVGYWIYGMEFACAGLSRLDAAELAQREEMARLAPIAAYPGRAHLYGPYFFSGNDAGLKPPAPLGLLPWLAAATDNAFLRSWFEGAPFDPAPPSYLKNLTLMLRYLAAPVMEGAAPPLPAAAPRQYLEDQQTAIFRDDAPDGGLLAALTGGSNAERHNHNDLGHFLLAVDGEWVIPDLACPFYTRDFFGPRRYTYLPASSRGHCCPVINGAEQYTEGGLATVLEWNPGEAESTFGLDLTCAYPPGAGLERWTRTLRHSRAQGAKPATATIGDVFQTVEPNTPVAHVIWSLFHPEQVGESTVDSLWQLGPLLAVVLPPPASSEVESYTASELNLRDWEGRTFYRLTLNYQTDKVGELRIDTVFRVSECTP